MGFLDGDKIAICLYAITRTTTREGQFLYLPFSSLSHVKHAVFLAAQSLRFLKVYDYKAGEYMPESEIVDKGIKEYLIYNPYYDTYVVDESKVNLAEVCDWLYKNLKSEEQGELLRIRQKCEDYSASELYLILHKVESAYIKNKKINYHMNKQIGAILSKLKMESYAGYKDEGSLTDSVYDKLMEYFKINSAVS